MICGGTARCALVCTRDDTMKFLSALPVRYRILAVLFVLSFVNYLLRNNLSVALPSIRKEFGFSSAELGWILGSFNFAYALLQIPGGLFGQWYGPRRALAVIAVTWGVLTYLTGFAPGLMAASAAGAMISLTVVRFLLGVANAPVYPIVAATIANWFPPGHWAFPNSVSSVGLTLGQAALGPLVTLLIVEFGWRESFYILAPLGLLCGAWWYWYGRDTPAEHRAVRREELAQIECGRTLETERRVGKGVWRTVLLQRDVLLLSAAYFCMNYVFYMFAQWLFVYLVEARGFSLLQSGRALCAAFCDGRRACSCRRAHLRPAVPTARIEMGLPVARDHRPRAGGHLPAGGSVRGKPVRSGHRAVAVLRFHAVHRGRLLVGHDVRRWPIHLSGDGRAQHRRQCRGFPCPARGPDG